jgi:hypothetical protein
MHFSRDKKKELAPNYAAYYPFGVDVYLSSQKLNHISRFVQLPDIQLSSKLPPLLVVNVQVRHKYTKSLHFFEVKVWYEVLLFTNSEFIEASDVEHFSVYIYLSFFFLMMFNISDCYTWRHLSN